MVIEWLKTLFKKRCKHESDGILYFSMPPKYRCVKCGKFYTEENKND